LLQEKREKKRSEELVERGQNKELKDERRKTKNEK
jgi:hypothetical protein